MKRILLGTIAVLALVLAACGSDGAQDSQSTVAAPASTIAPDPETISTVETTTTVSPTQIAVGVTPKSVISDAGPVWQPDHELLVEIVARWTRVTAVTDAEFAFAGRAAPSGDPSPTVEPDIVPEPTSGIR